MRIEFETGTISVKEGASLVAMMLALHGNEALLAELDAITMANGSQPYVSSLTADDTFAPPPPPPAGEAFADPSAASVPAVGAGVTNASDGASAPPAPAAPPVSGVELDTAGLPWDARIHAATKGKNSDGKWKGKKGANPQLIASVKAELLAALAASPPTTGAPAVPPPPPAAAPVAAAPPPPSAPVTAVPAAAPPPSATPAAAAPPVPAAVGTQPGATQAEFARVMRKITELQTAGRLTVDNTNAALTACGLAGLTDLLVRPDVVPTFEATVDALTTAAA